MKKKAKDEPVNIDGESLQVLTPPQIKLHDIDAVRREMARVYREVRQGVLPSDEGSRMIYMLDRIIKTLPPPAPVLAPAPPQLSLEDYAKYARQALDEY